MTRWTPIRYMGFWDVPLIFLVRVNGDTYLFDCPFNHETEDDEDDYQVYLMPDVFDDELPKDWTTLRNRAIRRLGAIPVASVRFDPTHRREVDISMMSQVKPDAAIHSE